MIIDLEKFIASEKPFWDELEGFLDPLEEDAGLRLDLDRIRRFHYLYQRAAADLGKLATFSAEPNIRRYLEQIVSRAYGQIYETRDRSSRGSALAWAARTFPLTFRLHIRKFQLAVAAMMIGFLLGAAILAVDPQAKTVLLPFSHLHGDPSQRVAGEEDAAEDRLAGGRAAFSSMLMTHNTRVSIFTLALGITWGIGTLIMLFYNGIILGAVFWDYITAGETLFLAGWLLPHGAVEIPAILIAGQAGLVLASAMIGWGSPTDLQTRLRSVSGNLATLIAGAALLLIWAGVVESFFSQYHEPVLPYGAKIAFGVTELLFLLWFLFLAGRKGSAGGKAANRPGRKNGRWQRRRQQSKKTGRTAY